MGSLSLLQGIFPTQGLNPGLPHGRQILYQLSHNYTSIKIFRKSCKASTESSHVQLTLFPPLLASYTTKTHSENEETNTNMLLTKLQTLFGFHQFFHSTLFLSQDSIQYHMVFGIMSLQSSLVCDSFLVFIFQAVCIFFYFYYLKPGRFYIKSRYPAPQKKRNIGLSPTASQSPPPQTGNRHSELSGGCQ